MLTHGIKTMGMESERRQHEGLGSGSMGHVTGNNVPWVNSFCPQVLLCHSSLVIVFPLPRQLDFGLTRE